jgi:UDP-N-acetylmuramyl tripeptide synthase
MKLFSIILGKTIIKVSRLAGNNGSALPGLIIEKLNPKFLPNTLNQLQEGVIIVSGTNGKTTTTKALANLLEKQGMTVLSNPTGSNFTRGVVSTILDKVTWSGKLKYHIAVLELDEAYSRIFVKSIKPRYVVLLNVMRDQLDRYGEIDTTARMLEETAQEATLGVIINQSDPRLAQIAELLKTKVTFFGVSLDLQRLLPTDDMMHDEEMEVVEYASKNAVELESYENQLAIFSVGGAEVNSELQTAGIHNALNMAAAIATIYAMNPNVDPEILMIQLQSIKPAWGRGEVCHVGDTTITLALVKNPAGMQQSIKSYAHDNSSDTIFAINDLYADGRDVSWLWDVDYTTIPSSTNLHTTGMRAHDMALRLMYADKTVSSINESETTLLQQLLKNNPQKVMIYCTYTAMLNIRKYLSTISDLDNEVWG